MSNQTPSPPVLVREVVSSDSSDSDESSALVVAPASVNGPMTPEQLDARDEVLVEKVRPIIQQKTGRWSSTRRTASGESKLAARNIPLSSGESRVQHNLLFDGKFRSSAGTGVPIRVDGDAYIEGLGKFTARTWNTVVEMLASYCDERIERFASRSTYEDFLKFTPQEQQVVREGLMNDWKTYHDLFKDKSNFKFYLKGRVRVPENKKSAQFIQTMLDAYAKDARMFIELILKQNKRDIPAFVKQLASEVKDEQLVSEGKDINELERLRFVLTSCSVMKMPLVDDTQSALIKRLLELRRQIDSPDATLSADENSDEQEAIQAELLARRNVNFVHGLARKDIEENPISVHFSHRVFTGRTKERTVQMWNVGSRAQKEVVGHNWLIAALEEQCMLLYQGPAVCAMNDDLLYHVNETGARENMQGCTKLFDGAFIVPLVERSFRVDQKALINYGTGEMKLVGFVPIAQGYEQAARGLENSMPLPTEAFMPKKRVRHVDTIVCSPNKRLKLAE